MDFLKKYWYELTLIFYLFTVPASILYADSSVPIGCPPGTICNPVPSITSIPGLIQTILTGVIKIGIPIVALAVIYCGFLFVSARGKPEKLTEAKKCPTLHLNRRGDTFRVLGYRPNDTKHGHRPFRIN